MTTWFPWLIAGFGFLFSVDSEDAGPKPKTSSLTLKLLWRETLDLFLTLSLILTVCDAAAVWDPVASEMKELHFLIGWGLAYLAGMCQKKSDLFFVSAAVISHAIFTFSDNWTLQMSVAGVVFADIFLLRAALEGLRYGLIFINVPGRLKGWPALCLLAFFVAVILGPVFSRIF